MIRRATIVLVAFAAFLLLSAPAFAVGPGVIVGTVVPASVAPEVEVCVVEPHPSELCTAPELSGSYRLTGVPVGPQRVEFVPSHRSGYLTQYFDRKSRLEEATTIQIGPPPGSEVKGIDAELELGSTVEGTVTSAIGGAPLPNVEVCVLGAGTRITFGCTFTGVLGAYAVAGLPGGVYKVGFWGRGGSAEYAPQFYSGKEAFNGATTVTVPRASSVTGIDAELTIGSRIEGRVTAGATGVALANVPVCLFAVSAVAPAQCVFTGPSGAYTLHGIAAGNYQVGFSLLAAETGWDSFQGEDDGFESQYYDGVATRAAASTIPVLSATESSGVDAALLAPPAPPMPAPILAAAAPIPATPTISEPKANGKKRKTRCKKGYRQMRIRGKVRCKRPARHKHKGQKQKKSR
ncbi:MAG TPA: carboxypeptidase-like regulatory domain-containing protein [Solirubrobacterales bacterium]|jgi:hypothetical protein